MKTLKEQVIKEWCVQSWSEAVRFGTPVCNRGELESAQKRAARFVTGNYNYCLRGSLFRPHMKLCFRKYKNSYNFIERVEKK